MSATRSAQPRTVEVADGVCSVLGVALAVGVALGWVAAVGCAVVAGPGVAAGAGTDGVPVQPARTTDAARAAATRVEPMSSISVSPRTLGDVIPGGLVRSIALVMYLSPGWQPSYGGALHMADQTGESRIEATFNSIVVFDVQAENTHLVAPIETAAGSTRRLTIGGWYPTPA